MRLDYTSERASVQIPYGYSGDAALKALYCGYTIARIVADETDAVAVDPRTGRTLPSLTTDSGDQRAKLAS